MISAILQEQDQNLRMPVPKVSISRTVSHYCVFLQISDIPETCCANNWDDPVSKMFEPWIFQTVTFVLCNVKTLISRNCYMQNWAGRYLKKYNFAVIDNLEIVFFERKNIFNYLRAPNAWVSKKCVLFGKS